MHGSQKPGSQDFVLVVIYEKKSEIRKKGMESGNQFIHEVKAMRDAQVKYFMTRNSSDLKKAKQKENSVDEFLRLILRAENEGLR